MSVLVIFVTINDYVKLKFVVIIARGNWVIYRNSIVRVERTNVLEKFSCSNSVADQIELCIESTFGFLKFEANRLRVVSKRLEVCSESTSSCNETT